MIFCFMLCGVRFVSNICMLFVRFMVLGCFWVRVYGVLRFGLRKRLKWSGLMMIWCVGLLKNVVGCR